MHPHVLRKFFKKKLGAVIPVDVAEALMGREGYLTEVYRWYSPEDLNFYLQGEPALSIFGQPEEIGKLGAEVEERNKQLQTLANELSTENLELRNRVARMELENTKVLQLLGELEEFKNKTLEQMRVELQAFRKDMRESKQTWSALHV